MITRRVPMQARRGKELASAAGSGVSGSPQRECCVTSRIRDTSAHAYPTAAILANAPPARALRAHQPRRTHDRSSAQPTRACAGGDAHTSRRLAQGRLVRREGSGCSVGVLRRCYPTVFSDRLRHGHLASASPDRVSERDSRSSFVDMSRAVTHDLARLQRGHSHGPNRRGLHSQTASPDPRATP